MRSALLASALLALLACGGNGQETTPSPAPPPAAKPTPPAPPTVAKPACPDGDLRGDASAGSATYHQFCATCHGAGGKGDGPAAPKNPAPADHTDAAYMGSLSDCDVYTVISKGGAAVGKSPLMAPWGAVLNDEQVRDVLAFVRGLSGT